MRVNSIQSHIKIYKNSNKEETNSNNFHKDFSNSVKKLPDYPVAYIKFAPSFGISLEEKLKKEELLKNEEMKQDYLWAISWDKDEAKKEYDLRAQKEIEIENQKKFFGNINDEKEYEIRRKYNNLYETDLKKYNNITEHKEEYKQLVDKDLLTRHKSITELIKMSRESLNKEIAGYSSLKRDMGRMFLEPIKKELITGVEEIENNIPKVANCILLCGPTGCGKTLAAETVAKETSCNILKIPTNTSANHFPEKVRDLVAIARNEFESRTQAIQKLKESEEYNEMSDEEKLKALLKIGSPRTVILIDEFDKYFNDKIVKKSVIDGNRLVLKRVFDGCAEWPKPNSGKAAAVTFLCTTNYPSRIPEELEVGKCEEDAENNKTILKGLLDHSSEKFQDDKMSDAAGVTFIFTSNYPSKIDTEISLRKGKCDKLAVSIPSIEDSKKIIKFYLNKENEKIKKLQSDGRNIDLIDISQLPIDRYDKRLEPKRDIGSLYGAGIKAAVEDAVSRYIESSDESVGINLPKLLTSSKYRLSNESLEIFKTEMENMGAIQHEIDGEEEYNLLTQAQNLDMMTEDQQKRYFSLKELYNG